MENRVKEQQLDLFADRTRCHDFIANPFRLLLASAAYVLIEHFRRVVLHLSSAYPYQALFRLLVARLASTRLVYSSKNTPGKWRLYAPIKPDDAPP